MQRPMLCASSHGSDVPRMPLTYLFLHVQCGCNTGGVYLPKAKLAAHLEGQSVDVLSSRNTGTQSAGDDVVMLQVVGAPRYGREDILTIHRSPSCAMRLAAVSHRFNNRLLGNKQ